MCNILEINVLFIYIDNYKLNIKSSIIFLNNTILYLNKN